MSYEAYDTYYIATRKDTGAHFLFNGPEYLENYERYFERIREFDDLDEAKAALAARESTEAKAAWNARKEKRNKNIQAGKLRGDVTAGSVADEELRAKIREELMAEMAAQDAIDAAKKAERSNAGPKTRKRTAANK